MITYYQAAELKRRIEKSLDAAWDAGHTCGTSLDDPNEVAAVEHSANTDKRVFRYIDHLAGVRSKKSKKR